MMSSDEKRFWAKVERGDPQSCWLWHGVRRFGYGRFRLGAKIISAHRFAWSLAYGSEQPPNKTDLCHSCDNPSCVNPAHLWWGTRQDNMRDMFAKQRRSNQRRTHCKHGHELTPENTYKPTPYERRCRACQRAATRRYYLAKKMSRDVDPRTGRDRIAA